MKSIKPGRGQSGMGFIGSIIAIIFGIFWTILAVSISAGSPFGGVATIFPLFGVLFIITGIVQAIYNYKNATGKDRYSILDITDSSEEGDPSAKWIKDHIGETEEIDQEETSDAADVNFCPYCGEKVESQFNFCPKCGKNI